MRIRLLLAALTTCLVSVCALPDRAAAFCGFYVSGAEADLYNEATVVSLMRQKQQTVGRKTRAAGPPPANDSLSSTR